VEILLKAYAFIFGAMVGSFLNVVILRLPEEKSLMGRSSCPQCENLIKWYMNIPILSFMFQGAKCRYCGAKISWQYPFIELICGIAALLLFPQRLELYYIAISLFHFFVFACFLAHMIIDIRYQILPDSINLFLLAIVLPYAATHFGWRHWLIGGVIGFGGTYAATYLFYKLKGVVGLGGGDIKLFGILGLMLGPLGIFQNIFLSCFVGSIIGGGLLITKKIDRQTPIAFGPFIIFVAFFQIFKPEWVKMGLKLIFPL
jgi:prepilin signal peptidase PulO-like enzyme (type II secretory pathway)